MKICLKCFSCFFVCVILFSCSNKQAAKTKESPLLDSLKDQCYDLLVQLQVDSLRMLAEEYKKAAPEGSVHYFKAQQFYINSYFTARDYDKVLSLLDKTEQMAYFSEHPAIVCDYMYTRARVYQYSSRYPEAIEMFKRCLAFTPEESKQEQILPSLQAVMTQLMNTYIISNKVEEGYTYFRQMKDAPSTVIQRFLIRDICVHLAYLTLETGRLREACHVADSVFIHPLYDPKPETLFRDYSYAALVYTSRPDMKERAIELLNKALNEADKYAYTAGVQWVVDILASIYWTSNKIEEGTELQYKALKMSQKRGDKAAECCCYISLANLYREWELYKQAEEYANQAISAILPTNDLKFHALAFRMKAVVKDVLCQQDSALYYYKIASQYADKAQQKPIKQMMDSGIASFLINYCEGDSLSSGVNMMRKVINEMGVSQKSFQYYCLGKGLIKQGRKDEGEVMLDSMYRQIYDYKVTYTEGVLEYVIDYYLSSGNHAKVAQYTTVYRKQMDDKLNEKISRKVASAMVEFQTEKKEQQLKFTQSELSVKDLRLKLFLIVLILLIFIVAGGVLWYFHKRKLHKNLQLLAEKEKLIALRDRELAEARLHEQELQLNSALENLREANSHSEQMREQLDEFLANRENQQNILSVTPSVFREKGETKFRSYFTQLYPGFLILLRESVPDITRGEEILAMLIALNQNMDEVADILCIERKSVKMSRYRLRKKIPVEPEVSLDEFIKGLL